MADDLVKYDPQLQAQASPHRLLRNSRRTRRHEDKILDNVLKYGFARGPGRLAALYQFGSRRPSRKTPNRWTSARIRRSFRGCRLQQSARRRGGSFAPRRRPRMRPRRAPWPEPFGTIPRLPSWPATPLRPVESYAGYEHMRYANPQDPLPVDTVIIGGYVLSMNDRAYKINKVLEYWSKKNSACVTRARGTRLSNS